MPEIIRRGGANPVIAVSPEEVRVWLRSVADVAGFADRELCAVQMTVLDLSDDGKETVLLAIPSLSVMVSNIPNSRGGARE